MEVRNVSVKDLIPYDRNTKKHDKTQINNVAESIKQYGFVQPIVIDKDNVVVIGHCRLLAAKQLKMKEVPCVCVDDLTEEQAKALRIVDNKSNESEWDFDILPEELAELDLSDFSFDFGIEDEEEESEYSEDDTEESFYTEKTEIPQYQPTGENVSLSDCFDDDKYKELLEKINNSSVTDDEKRFLICAATRHYRFTYKKIAEYYAQASEEMQDLMEQSALVIIDYENAIRNGYLKLRNRLEEIRNEK